MEENISLVDEIFDNIYIASMSHILSSPIGCLTFIFYQKSEAMKLTHSPERLSQRKREREKEKEITQTKQIQKKVTATGLEPRTT